MPRMSYNEFLDRRTAWEATGDRLMAREEVELFDDFFANPEESNQYQSAGFARAQIGDFSEYESVEPMMKAYLGSKKCYELYERYHGDASDPDLQREIKERLMEADLRTGFAMCGKDPLNPVSAFLKECDRIANRQMMMQTLEEPDPTAKLRLHNQFKREDAATADQKLAEALNNDLEQRVEIAKMLFLNHLGKFQVRNAQQPVEMTENMAEIYSHGGRTMFILPAGANQQPVVDGIQGKYPEQSGLEGRYFATHGIKPRTLGADGSITSEATELKARGASTFSFSKHKGMNASVGGLGHVGPQGKVITSDGTNGHMYMHLVPGKANTCGTMLVGFENAGPGKKGRLGHTHDASAKKAGSSAFLSDKGVVGKDLGGRVVDLSGLSAEELGSLLAQFEKGYRNAAIAAQNGTPAMLDACNDLLTGKLMSVGQMKGMLGALDVPQAQINSVEAARAGHSKATGYEAIAPEANPAIPLKITNHPEKKPVRVTEFEGLVRPEPPKVMKKPKFLDKVLHVLSLFSKNSYVSRYREYQQTFRARLDDYNTRLNRYNSNLEALERGDNPENLREAYENAKEAAKQRFGLANENPVASQPMNNREVNPAMGPASPEITARLENTLVNTIFDRLNPNAPQNQAMENQKNALLGHIRATDGYKRLIRSGDGNISAVLDDPTKMNNVLTDVTKGIMNAVGQNQMKGPENLPKRVPQMEQKPVENKPKVMGG